VSILCKIIEHKSIMGSELTHKRQHEYTRSILGELQACYRDGTESKPGRLFLNRPTGVSAQWYQAIWKRLKNEGYIVLVGPWNNPTFKAVKVIEITDENVYNWAATRKDGTARSSIPPDATVEPEPVVQGIEDAPVGAAAETDGEIKTDIEEQGLPSMPTNQSVTQANEITGDPTTSEMLKVIITVFPALVEAVHRIEEKIVRLLSLTNNGNQLAEKTHRDLVDIVGMIDEAKGKST
jgi:hypothetical protein